MPAQQAAPATAAQLARYGHIAARLRALMEERRWKPGDLNEAIGQPRSRTNSYGWLAGKAGPDKENAKKLAKLCGVPVAEMLPRTETKSRALVPVAPTPVAVARAPQVREVLTFGATSDGRARLRLEITLPAAAVIPLMQYLTQHEAVVTAINEQVGKDV